jgi:membrane protease YdiL (CAAX protease family)
MRSAIGAWARWALLDERARPRVLVRLGVHGVAVILAYLAGGALARLGPAPWMRAVVIAVQTALVVLVTWLAATRLDQRPFTSVTGPWDRRAVVEVGLGVALGAGLVGAIAAVEHVWQLAAYRGTPDAPSFVRVSLSILFFVSVAIEEELWFRGYQLTNLAEALEHRLGARASRGAALAISSVVFGLAHSLNPNASWISTANIAFGGLLLGAAFALTGRLGLAIGLHFAWNTAQCWLDMPVSGQVIFDDLLVLREEQADDLLTGGEFGPEGGLVGLAAMALGTMAAVGVARALPSGGVVREVDAASPDVRSDAG